jgi:hypothetical protein
MRSLIRFAESQECFQLQFFDSGRLTDDAGKPERVSATYNAAEQGFE